MGWLKLLIACLGGLVVVQTGLSFVHTRAWWVRMFDFPRAQLAVISAGLLAAWGAFVWPVDDLDRWEGVLLVLLATTAVVQVSRMVPYSPLWRVQVPSSPPDLPRSRRLRLVISNVCMQNRESALWLKTVRAEDPDVIVAVEADDWWNDAVDELAEDYPHTVRLPQDNTYGMLVFSRLPLLEAEVKHLVEEDVPSVFARVRLDADTVVRLAVLHPRPPRPDLRQDSDLRDAELVRAGRIVSEYREPTIVAGDLNDVAWSHTTHLFQRVALVLDPRVGRGLFSTFHAGHWFLRYPLDHVFLSRHFDVADLRRLGHVGSDHFPICIETALRADGPDRPEVPEPDADDHEEAADAVEDVRERQRTESPAERRERKVADR